MRRCVVAFAFGLAAALALVVPREGALACACCTEPGQRLEIVTPIDSYLRDELQSIAIASTARLYTDAGFPETVEGVESPSDAGYSIDMRLSEGSLVLSLSDADGNSGSIELLLPGEMYRFEVDPREGAPLEGGAGPTLYKEWKLEGEATLTGVFAAGGRRANAVLVLQGRGKGCTTAADFTHWTLGISGTGVRFMLLGDLRTGS
jgi:hypothetical protein